MTFHVQIYSIHHELLIQTWNIGEHSRDMEIDAAMRRQDVSHVKWWGDGNHYLSGGKSDLIPLTTVFRKTR